MSSIGRKEDEKAKISGKNTNKISARWIAYRGIASLGLIRFSITLTPFPAEGSFPNQQLWPTVGRRIGGDANGEIIFHTEGKGLRSQGDESGMQAKKRRFGGDDRRSRLCLRTLQARDSAEQQSGTKLERTSKSAEKECASGKGRLGAQVVHLAKGIAPDHAAPRSLKLLSKMGDPG